MAIESATASTVLQSMSLMELTPSARSVDKWFVRVCATSVEEFQYGKSQKKKTGKPSAVYWCLQTLHCTVMASPNS